MDKNITKVKILGMEYKIVCPPDEARLVEEAAVYLNKKLKEIRQNSKIDEERASILAALNITNEYLKNLSSTNENFPLSDKLRELSSTLEDQIEGLSKIKH